MYTNHFRICYWLVKNLLKKSLTFEEINKLWIEDEKMSGKNDMSQRSFHRYKKEIKEKMGIDILCKEKGDFAYYIYDKNCLEDEGVSEWMFNTLAVSEKLQRCISLKDCIRLEPIPSGGEILDVVTEAMLNNCRFGFEYQKYGSDEITKRDVGICGLVLYHRRWYIVGEKEKKSWRTFALDRMIDPYLSNKSYKRDPDFSINEYFDDIYGIFNTGADKIKITLRAFGLEPYYMRDLPIHHSQKEVGSGEGYADFQIEVRPNNELISYILSRKNLLKVVAPKSFLDAFLAELHSINIIYT